MTTFLSVSFFIVGAALAYWFWLRPLLKARPLFSEFYARSDSFWSAIWMKFSTIKTKIASGFLMIASALVSLHDFLIPIATGIDWSPITGQVPPYVWPLVSFGLGAMYLWLRQVTATAAAQKIIAVDNGVITAAQAIKADDAGAEVAAMTTPAPPTKGVE